MPGSTEDCAQLRACKTASTLQTDVGPICANCGKDRPERTSGRRRRAATSVPVRRSKPLLPPGYTFRPPTGRSSVEGHPLAPLKAAARTENAKLVAMPCETCEGDVGRARWINGHRKCTKCAPLKMVAVGLNKAAPDLQLASTVTPDQVASGRRRS